MKNQYQKRNRNPRIAKAKHLACLSEMREDFLKLGKLRPFDYYIQKYSISPSIKRALVELNILRVSGKNLHWVLNTPVNENLVDNVRNRVKGHTEESRERTRIRRESRLEASPVRVEASINLDSLIAVYETLPVRYTRSERIKVAKNIVKSLGL